MIDMNIILSLDARVNMSPFAVYITCESYTILGFHRSNVHFGLEPFAAACGVHKLTFASSTNDSLQSRREAAMFVPHPESRIQSSENGNMMRMEFGPSYF
eukprot:370784_1